MAQEEILFQARPIPYNHTFTYNFDFEERFFEMDDGIFLHAIHAKTADSLRGLVIFFHGNASNNQTAGGKFKLFLNAGFDVLHPDYRGYGKSGGNIESELKLINDMDLIYKEMSRFYGEEKIVLAGYSIGSGIAAQVAVKNNPRMLILWAPFYSILEAKKDEFPFIPDFLVKYTLQTNRVLSEIEEPVHIIFAGQDEILPLERTFKLTSLLKAKDQYFILKGQGHNGIYRHPEMKEIMNGLLK